MEHPNRPNERHQISEETNYPNQSKSLINKQRQDESVSVTTNEGQETRVPRSTGLATVPRPNENNREKDNGVQATSSFHSVSSMDSSAEMEKYFPHHQTPRLSPFRNNQQSFEQQINSTSITTTTNMKNVNVVSHRPAPTIPGVQSLPQSIRPSMIIQKATGPRQPPPGIPSYLTQVEGLSISQALVNDVIVDLQSKIINESQQQYLSESSNDNYLEALPPIHIRAPNPTIILRSDLNRLRAEFNQNVRARAQHQPGGTNQFYQHRFQSPHFPTRPQQHSASGNY